MNQPVSLSALCRLNAQAALLVAILLGMVATTAAANPATPVVLFSADAEGHVLPCSQCPVHIGFGGLARRATLLQTQRGAHPDLLLVDAGNFLFGEDSVASEGAVVTAAYDALKYTAVNMSYRDFAEGKAHTLDLLKSAKIAPVSANVFDESSAKLLFAPYIIAQSGGKKIAFIGLTKPPLGIDMLPHVKKQLAGLRIDAPADALAAILPKAKGESDLVVVLFYGSASDAVAIQKQFPQVAAILVGGVRPERLPTSPNGPPLIGVSEHGKSLGKWSPGAASIDLPIDPSLADDAGMQHLLDRFVPPVVAVKPMQVEDVDASTQPASQPAAPSSTQVVIAPEAPAMPPVIVPQPDKPTVPPVVISHPDMPKPPVIPPPVAMQPDKEPHRRVKAHPPLTPRGLEGVGLTAEQVNTAIEKGRTYLWGYIDAEHKQRGITTLVSDGHDLLATLALVHADAHKKIPEFDAQLREYLTRFNPRATQLPTYEAGLFCMLIEAYGDPIYLPKLRDTARYILEMQGPGGTWAYGHPLPESIYGTQGDGKALAVLGGTPLEGPNPGVEMLTRVTPYLKEKDGDNSVSQFALLGLQSASLWHIQPSPETWKRNLAANRDRQCVDGGWDYVKNGDIGYGSMSCAGICATAIDRFELGEKNPVDDESLERGLAWLDENFSVTANPRSGGYQYYYLYSLERVGRILDTEFIGTHEWYPLGAKYLVDHQRADGRWIEGEDEVEKREPTSFALLFLTRATATLAPEVARNGSGELRTSLVAAPPARLYIILDASGSMLDEMDGRMKFDLARDAVAAMLSFLPAHSEAALRVYGHRKRSIEEGADEDTELLIPMGDYEATKFNIALKGLRSRGKTPLALSLTQAATDLGTPQELTTVVLLTDGGEDTMPRRDPVRAATEFGKVPNVNFHIIGFDVNQDDWSQQLHEMAKAAHAQYWPAPKGSDLLRALRAALLGDPDYFIVLDSTGKEVHRGKFGLPKRLPEGKYELVTPFNGKEFHQSFWINTNGMTAVTFDATLATRDKSASIATTSPVAPGHVTQPPTVSPLAKRFCTNCGKPLAPGAKFCTNCGAKVQP